MSVEPIIRCDGRPGGPDGRRCNRRGYPELPWHRTATKVRRWLRQRGWHRTTDGRDICPGCWEDGSYKPGAPPSPNWCSECQDRKPCVCDDDRMPMAEDDDYDDLEP